VTLITKSIIRDKHPAVQGAYSRIDDIQKLVVGFAVAAMRPVSRKQIYRYKRMVNSDSHWFGTNEVG
jgi:hypothetical protein